MEGELYVTGRMKDLIILNGRNMHPQSLEWIVAELPGVRPGNVVAFSVPGKETEDLVIALERKGDADPSELEKLVTDLIARQFGVGVKEVVVLDSGFLPKTSSGKLQRRKTRQQYLMATIGKMGSRSQGGSADKIALARHMAKSVWTRMKHAAFS